ncbi:MAG: hypothetical protein ACLTSZ_08675 [Lachnospiraceae bacterium]
MDQAFDGKVKYLWCRDRTDEKKKIAAKARTHFGYYGSRIFADSLAGEQCSSVRISAEGGDASAAFPPACAELGGVFPELRGAGEGCFKELVNNL